MGVIMNKVAILTDTASYMPQQIANEHNIRIVPLHVSIGDKSYPENGMDLGWFYKQMSGWKQEGTLPTTSAPSIGDFLEAYRELSQQAQAILYVGYSPKLGMALNVARQAKEMAKEELPQTAIEVIDSRTACGAQMLVTLEASRATAAGKSLVEVTEVASNIIKKANFIFLADDLYYLAKGGRIHKARPWSSSKITNTVLLEMDAATGGENTPLARCKTKGQTLNTLFELIRERSGGKKLHVAINHADAQAEAEELRDKSLSQFSCAEVFINRTGPVVTIHTGVGSRIFNWWSED
jgi:DegV family protein with EDD domain